MVQNWNNKLKQIGIQWAPDSLVKWENVKLCIFIFTYTAIKYVLLIVNLIEWNVCVVLYSWLIFMFTVYTYHIKKSTMWLCWLIRRSLFSFKFLSTTVFYTHASG